MGRLESFLPVFRGGGVVFGPKRGFRCGGTKCVLLNLVVRGGAKLDFRSCVRSRVFRPYKVGSSNFFQFSGLPRGATVNCVSGRRSKA